MTVSNELGELGKEVVMILAQNYPEGIVKKHKKLSQDSWSLGPPECEERMLITQP
jgi:hypothetical protein